jgi:hypothetical protein
VGQRAAKGGAVGTGAAAFGLILGALAAAFGGKTGARYPVREVYVDEHRTAGRQESPYRVRPSLAGALVLELRSAVSVERGWKDVFPSRAALRAWRLLSRVRRHERPLTLLAYNLLEPEY